ncbi:MAG: hypothetical protein OXC00_14455 [Acidimicrobiaceae bacterium]|nr:hypothetical protein [Acidimicrobiaceae bacterium]
MSLTLHLSRRESPVRVFMQDCFGAASAFVRHQNASLGDLVTIRPQAEDAPYPLLGTAVDYRIRFYFQDAINQHLVAQEGARLVSEGGLLDLGNVSFDNPDLGPRPYPTLEASFEGQRRERCRT